jgi:hypothetical protein
LGGASRACGWNKEDHCFARSGGLNGREDLKSFAGTIIYRKQIHIEKAQRTVWLNLGHLHAVSELQVNGHALGIRWHGNHRYDLSASIVPGENSISIKVVTTLGNYMKTLRNNPTAMTWTSGTPFYPLGLIPPISLMISERSSGGKPYLGKG